MAVHIVSFVVERLGDLLIQEASSLHGVRENVQQLKDKLSFIQCFLKYADAKQEEDELVRKWVADIRDVSYDAEDLIDKFLLKVESSKRRSGIQDILMRPTSIFSEFIVSKEIETIQNRIHNISRNREIFGIRNINEGEGTSSNCGSTNQRLMQLRRSYPHVEDRDIIGVEKDIEILIAELIKEEELLGAVSIVGMGGLGKTTLAKKVYNHDVVKRHFHCYAWCFISQQCRMRDVLEEIIKQVGTLTYDKKMEKMKDEELVVSLHQFLRKKRYLLVLDDIWSTEAWDSLKSAFPNGIMGSKLLLTTRNKEVAWRVDARGFLHQPQCLTEEQSWELLCKKAFIGTNTNNTSCPPSLEKVGREMVRKCNGLPLAVAVLGGLLATKSSLIEWENVYRNMRLHFTKGQLGVEGILALSYKDLPYQLKSCFLYLGLYPEDFEIHTKRMIKLWIAEGFIQAERGEMMEDIGEEYLAELINRCMVQMAKSSPSGRVKTIRVHDLMRDLCISKGKEQNFLDISRAEDSIVPFANTKVRRLAIHYSPDVPSKHKFLLRTILFFKGSVPLNIEIFKSRSFRLLRVLDLKGAELKIKLQKEIGKLVNLRYLGLHHARIQFQILKSSMADLHCLQTLDLRVGDSVDIPYMIWRMSQLRHLYLNYHCKIDQFRVDRLINLQTLHRIKAGRWIEKGLGNLIHLRKLGIDGLSRSQAEVVLDSIVVKSKCPLSSLYLKTLETFPNLEPLSHCQHLLKLSLDGHIENIPQWPPNLTKLVLRKSRLKQDQMATLQNLPNLIFLQLFDAFQVREMVFSSEQFPQLQILHLHFLEELEEWIVEDGAMPCLTHIQISNCKKLRMIPEGLGFIFTLQNLELDCMPPGFNDRVRGGGEDRYKVQHIPSITFTR